MNYSIRITIDKTAKSNISNIINKYSVSDYKEYTEIEGNKELLIVELWLTDKNQRAMLFNEFKDQVDLFGGVTDWHICTHKDSSPAPCVLEEVYNKGW